MHSYHFPNVISSQVDDDGSLSGLVVHMWNIIIHSEVTFITSGNSLAHMMHHVIYVISLIRAIILES